MLIALLLRGCTTRKCTSGKSIAKNEDSSYSPSAIL